MRIILSVVFLTALADAFVPLSIGTTRSSSTGGRRFSSSSSLAAAGTDNKFDFDVAIVGCGVGGHGAALHARAQSLTTAVFAANDVGGTCVNRGCVPSKALLAASGRVRDMQNESHLAALGITVDGAVKYDRAGIAAHAQNLADKVKMNLEGSLTGLGVQVIPGRGVLTGVPHEIKDESTGKIYTAKVTYKYSKWGRQAFRRRHHHHVSSVASLLLLSFPPSQSFHGDVRLLLGHYLGPGIDPVRATGHYGGRIDRVYVGRRFEITICATMGRHCG